jgi:septal ring factor EnvC (AmiA/AmiB activator)
MAAGDGTPRRIRKAGNGVGLHRDLQPDAGVATVATVAQVETRRGLPPALGVSRLALGVCVLITALLVPTGRPARAQTDRERTSALRAHIAEASAEEARLLEQIEEATARKQELDAKVAAIDKEIAPVQRQLQAAQSRLSALETRQRAVEAELARTREQLAAAKDDLARQAIAASREGARRPAWRP